MVLRMQHFLIGSESRKKGKTMAFEIAIYSILGGISTALTVIKRARMNEEKRGKWIKALKAASASLTELLSE